MYNPKLFLLYLIGGTFAIGVLMYDLSINFPVEDIVSIIEDSVVAIILYFLAYKSYQRGAPAPKKRSRHKGF